MKHKILFTLQLGLVLALLFTPKAFLEQNEATDSQAGSSVNAGVSVVDIYNKMIAQFTIGERTDDFDGAMETYQLYSSLPLQPYSDAEEYYRYMQAREFLVQGKFSDAEILFRSLDSFHNDSQLYAAYAAGRIAESEGRYGDAVSYYIVAAGLNKKTGSGSDVVERMLDCNNKISDEQKASQYKEAIIEYEIAKEAGDPVRISQVMKAFTALAGYQDADNYANVCAELLKALTRRITVTTSTNINSAFVSWVDTAEQTEEEESQTLRYNVIWKPVGCKQAERQMNCASPVTLAGLIPGTDYEITVLDADSETVATTVYIQTPSPQSYPRDVVTFNRMDIAGINPITLDLEYTGTDGSKDKITPLAIFQMGDDFLFRQPENGYTASDVNSYVLYGGLVFTNQTGQEMSVSIQVVLRSPVSGTYQTEAESFQLLSETRPQMIPVNIDEAFTKMQEDSFSLTAGQYIVEVYMDGQFLCSESITIL